MFSASIIQNKSLGLRNLNKLCLGPDRNNFCGVSTSEKEGPIRYQTCHPRQKINSVREVKVCSSEGEQVATIIGQTGEPTHKI